MVATSPQPEPGRRGTLETEALQRGRPCPATAPGGNPRDGATWSHLTARSRGGADCRQCHQPGAPRPLPCPGGHSLAWTCRQHLAQAISRLVPSSSTQELAGSGSVFPPLQVKHISGIRGRVFWPLLEGGGVEGPSAAEAGGASFSVCRDYRGRPPARAEALLGAPGSCTPVPGPGWGHPHPHPTTPPQVSWRSQRSPNTDPACPGLRATPALAVQPRTVACRGTGRDGSCCSAQQGPVTVAPAASGHRREGVCLGTSRNDSLCLNSQGVGVSSSGAGPCHRHATWVGHASLACLQAPAQDQPGLRSSQAAWQGRESSTHRAGSGCTARALECGAQRGRRGLSVRKSGRGRCMATLPSQLPGA